MTTEKVGCVATIVIVLAYIAAGCWSVVEILSWFGKSIPFIAATLIGIFLGELSIPIAIVGCILRAFGVF